MRGKGKQGGQGRRVGWLAIACLWGCGRINYEVPTLTVQPTIVCPGDSVTVRWSPTQDEQTVEANPPIPGFNGSAASHEQRVTVTAPTDFSLGQPINGRRVAWNTIRVSVFDVVGMIPLPFCRPQTTDVTVPAMVPPSVEVAQIYNPSPMQVLVTKGTQTAHVPPRGGSVNFVTSLAGRYTVTPEDALPPGTLCPQPMPPTPTDVPPPPPGTRSFSVSLIYACPAR